jgi:hypothetical protein
MSVKIGMETQRAAIDAFNRAVIPGQGKIHREVIKGADSN